MLPSTHPRSFIVSVTLTELAIMLFFLLLLTAVGQINRLKEDLATSEARLADKDRLSNGIASIEDTLRSKGHAGAAELVEEAARNVGTLEEMSRQNRGLRQLVQESSGKSDDDFTELVREAAENTAAQDELSQLKEKTSALGTELSDAETGLAECQSEVGEVGGRAKRCEEQAIKRGWGFPPCWVSADGKPEYIYTIHIGADTFTVTAEYPPNRKDDFLQDSRCLGCSWFPNDTAGLSRACLANTAVEQGP